MRTVWAVIRREYVERVRTRWFLATTLGGPLVFLALTVLPVWFASRGETAERTVAVVDETGRLEGAVRRRLEEAGYVVEVVAADDAAAVDRATRRSAAGDIGGLLWLDEETLERGRAVLTARSGPSAIRRMGMRGAVVQAALEARRGEGSDARELLRGGELEVAELAPSGSSFEEAEFLRIYMGAFLLYMVILFYAVAVMRSTLEEKTSRIVEVIISSMRPWHLMLGKILGVGAVGLTQLAVWAGFAAAAAATGLPLLVAARPELGELDQLRAILPDAGYVALFLTFFLGGYFIYAAIYAAVGAMVSSEQEAQQAQFPVIVLLVAPIILIPGVIQDPASTTSTVLSLVPFFSPILMFARAVGGAAPAWQVAASFVAMAVTVVGLAWLAGRIYRVGILMSGKRPSVSEIVRWIRQA